jgi:lipopolysaccharide transport system ATP-binding protein
VSRFSVQAESISKRYRIAHPQAPRLADYLRRPRWAQRQPRSLDVQALQDVSFEVREGEVFGIIGRNGAGKSTLLKILSRITSPSDGRAIMTGRVASLLEVGTGFHPDLTGRENIYLNGMLLGMASREVDRVFDEICEFSGVGPYIDSPIKRYSSGMQLRLAFAVAAHLAADIMIVDEVLAVGDAEFQAKCTNAMRGAAGRGRTTLFVSHNLGAVESLCTRVMLLNRGRVVAIGSPADVIGEYLRHVGAATGDKSEWVASPDDSRHDAVRFTRVAVSGLDGRNPAQGDTLRVTADIDARVPVRRLQVMVSLSTAEGMPVAASSNGDYRAEWDITPGFWRMVADFPAVRLTPRAYSVSVRAFIDWGAEVFDEVEHAVTVAIASRDVLGTGVVPLADRGVTWLPAEFQCARLTRAGAPEERGAGCA